MLGACGLSSTSGVPEALVDSPDSLRQSYEKLECGAAVLSRFGCPTLLQAMLDSVAGIISPSAKNASGLERPSLCDDAMTTLAISQCLDSLSAIVRRRIALRAEDIRRRLPSRADVDFDQARSTWSAYERAFCATHIDSIVTGSFIAIARSSCYYDLALTREAVLKQFYTWGGTAKVKT